MIFLALPVLKAPFVGRRDPLAALYVKDFAGDLTNQLCMLKDFVGGLTNQLCMLKISQAI